MAKLKKITGIALAGCMALSSLMMTAGAAEVSSDSVSKGHTLSGDIAAASPTSLSSVDVSLNCKQTSQLIPWSVYSGYGYWKIMLKNESASTTRVKILKDSPTGTQVGETMVIPAYTNMSFYCDESSPLETGAYYLSITTNGTNALKGHLFYKFSTHPTYIYNGISVGNYNDPDVYAECVELTGHSKLRMYVRTYITNVTVHAQLQRYDTAKNQWRDVNGMGFDLDASKNRATVDSLVELEAGRYRVHVHDDSGYGTIMNCQIAVRPV